MQDFIIAIAVLLRAPIETQSLRTLLSRESTACGCPPFLSQRRGFCFPAPLVKLDMPLSFFPLASRLHRNNHNNIKAHPTLAQPSSSVCSAHARGSPLSGLGTATVWRRAAAGRMLLSPLCFLLPPACERTLGGERKVDDERGPWP
ncbi:hypothetical protein SRHO_G00001930 [Serrasalmus rhombeus]